MRCCQYIKVTNQDIYFVQLFSNARQTLSKHHMHAKNV